jgi:hypothetical protein
MLHVADEGASAAQLAVHRPDMQRRGLDRLGSGHVARTLLGLVLGVGAAFVVHQRRLDLREAWAGKSHLKPWGTGDWTATLTAAAVVALLAVFSPNIDNWLRRVTSVKTTLVEFQISSQSLHQVAVAENLEQTMSAFTSAVDVSRVYHKGYFLYNICRIS